MARVKGPCSPGRPRSSTPLLDSRIGQQIFNGLNLGQLLLKKVTLRLKKLTSVFARDEPLPNEKAESLEVVSRMGMNRLLFQVSGQRFERLGWPVLQDLPDHLCGPGPVISAEDLLDRRRQWSSDLSQKGDHRLCHRPIGLPDPFQDVEQDWLDCGISQGDESRQCVEIVSTLWKGLPKVPS